MTSITYNLASRLAISTFITALHFKAVVIQPTLQAISEAETVTVSLVASNVCLTTFLLVFAADAAAKQIIKNRNSKNSHNIKETIALAEDPVPDYKLAAKVTETSTSTAHLHSTDLESESTTPPSASPIPAHPQTIIEDLHSQTIDTRHSFDSETTLVDGSDDDSDISSEMFHKVTTMTQPLRKPPDDELDTFLAPGSRTKARIASLRQRTRAVIKSLPATTEASIYKGRPAMTTAAKRTPAAATFTPISMAWPSLRREGRVGWIP